MNHNDVTVNLKLSMESGTAGFGYPLIFTGKLTKGYGYAECTSLDEVARVIGGVTSTDDEKTIATKTATARSTSAYKAAQLIWNQNNPPRTIAVYGAADSCLTALPTILDKGWRHLIVASIGTADEDSIQEIAAYIETTNKAYYYSTTDYATDGFTTGGYKRSIGLFYADDFTTPSAPTSSVECAEAALVGAVAGKPAGSVNYKNLILKGLTPLDIDSATLTAVHGANLITVLKKSGDIVTSNGKTTNGYYCDLLDAEDWIILELIYRTQKFMNGADKVAYDNTGIAALENICVGVIKEACEMGIVARSTDENGNVAGYDYEVNYQPRENTTAAERSARTYTRGAFRVVAAGAIDTCEINGVLEI